MTNEELIQTYVDLLIIQYADPNNQPNALATIALISGEAIANQVVGQVGNAYSISTIYGQSVAQGVQLNVLGQFVGAQRNLPGYASTLNYFSLADTTTPYTTYGFGDTTTPSSPPTDLFADTTAVTGTYVLTDGEMIQLILYLAESNNAYLSVEVVDNILFEFFGSYVTLTDNQNMSVTYTDSGSDPGTLFGIVNYLNAFPHPAGVEVIA